MRWRCQVLIILILLLTCAPLGAEERFFDSAGVRIRYVEKGKGEPVVLIHGFSRNVEVNWIAPGISDGLARRYRVIALDARGHGKSDKPAGDGAYGETMVEDILRLLDHAKIERTHLIGYSMGGRIALKLATTHAHRVRSSVLIGAGAARKEDDLWDRVADSLDSGDGIRPLILKIWPGATDEQIRQINEQVLAANESQALASVARRYREFATSNDAMKSIRVPILALLGSRDTFRSDVDTLKNQMPGLRTRIIESADHVSILERPELLEIVNSFLN
jgi:pimeloyl-ACP methyl ester carboxylesterase